MAADIETARDTGCRAAFGSRRVEMVRLGDFRMFVDLDTYAPEIVEAMRNGTYEAPERAVLPALLAPGDRVMEIGSAVGSVTLEAARIVGADNVVGFEANPALIADARTNFALNGISIPIVNAVLQNRAHWAGPGAVEPFFVNTAFWCSSLTPTEGTAETITVPALCFENEARRHRANVLICDIEGGEARLLTRAEMTGFTKILLEIHYWAGRSAINTMLRALVIGGFDIDFDLSGGSIVTLRRGSGAATQPGRGSVSS